MLPTFRFSRFIFRPARIADLTLARAWNAVDDDHIWERHFPLYWIHQVDRANSYVFEDEKGVLFFIKSIRNEAATEVEINVQFDRQRKDVSVLRLMIGMMAGFDWLKQTLMANGYEAVYFVTRDAALCAFAEKRLGFTRDGDREIYYLKGERHGQARNVQAEEGRPQAF